MNFLVILLIAFSASLASAEALFMDQSTTSLTLSQNENGTVFDQIETNYAFGDEYPMQTVFKTTTTSRWWSYIDGLEETTDIQTFKADDAGKFQPAWQRNVAGGDFKVLNSEIGSVTASGCCGSPDIGTLLRLTDGRRVVEQLNNSLLDVRVPNTSLNHRYLASIVDEDAPKTNGSRTYIGSIGYFSAGGLIMQVRIYAALPEGWGAELTDMEPILVGSNTSQTWNDQTVVDLWESDGQTKSNLAFKDFGIKGKIYYESEEQTFSVKISGDKMDRSASSFSAGLRGVFVQ